MKQSERYSYIIDWFDKNMPTAESELHYSNAFELLVAIVLSHNVQINVLIKQLQLYFHLILRLKLWLMLQLKIQAHIKSISYPNNKAKHLQGLSQYW